MDIDGVLYPWEVEARRALYVQYGIRLPESTEWYSIKNGVPRHAWRWLWSQEGADAVFGTGNRYAAMVMVTRRLIDAGHEVHFVTHRNPDTTALHTVNFLRRHFGGTPWAGLHSGPGLDKVGLMPWDLIVEDKVETVMEALARRTFVFCPVRPWNRDIHDLEDPLLTMYQDPSVIMHHVEAAS